ncbi:ArsR/SmtB family transcription factor [Clostridium formicaceticum]|uniref:Transcriptional regulator n=1 Tax=Clostridium formicaceticum TaxID=1497 RepID=A0AAC9RM80_9CLOT|nr:metalloregulator ArsR/SmtB family transcription factor [Clostridium formicaceticum]AOY77612.1 transcriptional regulator [Clostridium formicaceticum]ARE88192.1 putative HTH-type transcriptional regulator [Clostridium formicaceticum]
MSNQNYRLCASLLKSLSHPTRLEILELLKDKNELCVCEIYEKLDLEQSNVSQHLKILKDQGILSSRKEGLMVFYRVNYLEIYEILQKVKLILQKQLEESLSHLL